jgi:hypothetical protein
MNHTILVEDFISPSFFSFFRITKHLSRFTRDKNLIFFLMEESIYDDDSIYP